MTAPKRTAPVGEPAASPGQVLSQTFKERRLKLSEDRLSVTGDKATGYQTVLAEHSANHGEWYFEVTIEELPENSHVRIGWSTRRTRYDQPIGSDCFSYGIRDIDCARISLARRWAVGDQSKSLKAGDVVGCFVRLPHPPASPRGLMAEDSLTFLPNLLCDPEAVSDPEMLSSDSSMVFSVNGESLGTAFTNLVVGEFYPAVSIFAKGKVRFNFGPEFKFSDGQAQPACEMFVPKELLKPKRRPPNFIPRGLTSGA